MSTGDSVGKLTSVSYNSETDDVLVVFRITDQSYKDYALRWARQHEGRLVIIGDQLLFDDQEEMWVSGRREG